jgi:hypothetical protein
MELSEFFSFISRLTEDRPEYERLGQRAFNLLYSTHPEIANQIRGTKYDPFYVDSKIVDFLVKLLEFVHIER